MNLKLCTILFIGDVVGDAGRRALSRVLPRLKKEYGVDVCIVNGENAAQGNGLTPMRRTNCFRRARTASRAATIPSAAARSMAFSTKRTSVCVLPITVNAAPDGAFAWWTRAACVSGL